VSIADCRGFYGGSWYKDDTIVFAEWQGGLKRVSAGGGDPETILAPDDATIGYSQAWPQILPDGKSVLFTTWKGDPIFENRARVGVLSLETGEW
jgi:hypothetical protein